MHRRYFVQMHATHRAWERYGLVVAQRDLQEIKNRIAGGLARPGREPDEWVLWFRDRLVRVLYDPKLDAITTFLPPREGRP